ncbi:hypothetical protein [Natronorarus salvus]|uniref:hypothetical protein n=1 Tax=Natronorarus salvus TaxID=3117733 RepID=UPI002F26BE25
MTHEHTAPDSGETTGYRPSNRSLGYVAAALAYAVALLHLFHPTLGTPAFVAYTLAGTPFVDPRPAAFVLSGVAILVGANLVLLGAPRRPIYLAGMVLMIVHIAGYVGWHAFGHGAWWPLLERHGHSHSIGEILLGPHHLRGDSLALAAKLSEFALLVVLALLYRRES